MQGFQFPCFGTSSWLLENGERDLGAVMLPKAAAVAKAGFTGGLKWWLHTPPAVGLGQLCLTQGQRVPLPQLPMNAQQYLAPLQPAVRNTRPLSHGSGCGRLMPPAKTP